MNFDSVRAWFVVHAVALLAALPLGAAPKSSPSPLKVVDLRCEYLVDPIGIDESAPRLSWRLEAAPGSRGQVQAGYRILVASTLAALEKDRGDLWDVATKSADTAQIAYAGKALTAHTQVFWKVQVTDGSGQQSAWSSPATWSMGLLSGEAWRAEWIGLDGVPPSGASWLPPAQEKRTYVPVTQLRKEFTVAKAPARAVLYVTALGNVEARLNGRRVGDEYFTPGWTGYRKRLYYRAYDVTALLRAGNNAVGALLADGWFRGNVGAFGQNIYGKNTRLRAELHLFDASGRSQVIATDASWKASTGPILEADMQAGESYDARLEQKGWDAPGFDDRAWSAVATGAESVPAILRRHPAPAVRRVAERPTVAVNEPKAGTYVFDLGQNFAGFAHLTVDEPAGTVVRMRFAEMLQPDGTVYVENLRTARVIDTYVCRGGGVETWEPRFTFHGFRYVQVEGLTKPPPAATITGVVLSTANADAGAFESSSALLNQIWSNTRWGQLSNYLEVPTDCPQRDERLGWTGDAQVFVRTGAYNQDIAAFMTKWMDDLVDTQSSEGAFNDTAPIGFKGSAAGWADAGIIIPWTLWKVYGDTRVLERNYEAMRRYVEYVRGQSQGLIAPNRGYGDWLAIGGITEKHLISTAYLAYDAKLMAEMASALGKGEDAASYRQLFEEVRAAFQKKFINADGSIGEHKSQTAHLLALRFDLLTPEQRTAATSHLVKNLEDRNWRLGVGFLGVNLLLPTLTDVGHTDGAYYTITGTEFPSWGYSVAQGATTIWERWNSFTKAHGFGDAGMNSFNHYAYGSCVEWLYRTVLGIDGDPGFARVVIRPEPGPGVNFARGHYDSVRGRIATSWSIERGELTLAVTLPPNLAGEIHVPATSAADVREGDQPAAQAPGLKFLRMERGAAVFSAGSGDYRFRAPYLARAVSAPPVPGKSNAEEEERATKVKVQVTDSAGYSLNTKIGVLLDDPAAKAALMAVIPEAINNPEFEQAREATFAQLHDFAPEYFTTERLGMIAAALAKLGPPKWSVDASLIGDLLADPATLAILQKHAPEAANNPEFSQAASMTLRKVAEFAADYFTEDRLKAIDADLVALGAAAPSTPHAAPAAPPQAPAPSGSAPLGLDSKIGDLLDHPATKAVLAKHLGAMIDAPQFAMARGITLRQLQPHVKDVLTDAKLQAIGAELATAVPAPVPAAGSGFGLDTKIGELLDHPAAKAVLEKHIAAMIANPQFAMARGITLRQLQSYAEDALPDAVLTTIADELAKLSPPAAQTGSTLSTHSTVSALLADPSARAVLARHLPTLLASPQIAQAGHLTLRALKEYFPEMLTPEKLAAIDAELAAATAPAKAGASLYIPDTISPAWQAFLRTPPFTVANRDPQPSLDAAAWAERWRRNEEMLTQYESSLLERYQPELAPRTLGGTPVLDVKPRGWKDDGRILVYCHGGGYTMGSVRSTLYCSLFIADATKLRLISVDYTVAPRAKWPRIIDEVLAVFQALQQEGYALRNIAICGDSAGGGLAAGAVLRMRDRGLGLPAAAVLWSPCADLSGAGESYVTLRDADPIISPEGMKPCADAYADPADVKNPYVSPVYGDYTKGFPPTLIQGGTREIFLSSCVRQYQAIESAGQPAILDLYEGMIHVFQPMVPDSPESQLAMRKMTAFLDEHVTRK
ncbi:MAG: family 78 glycoside hydrolase catalytic domain [Opitutaceae bacterium]|nr:family 78 glycoside hydrolase catalytic domain [Opitutaceae bacterium]